jgi:putative phosphoesterase
MRILVVSDIHANLPALAAIDEPYDICLCLGDLVDYGPEPAPCVRWAMDHATYAVRGNHDHGVAQGIPVSGEIGFRYLTRSSRPSMWEALGAEERRYLLQLPVTQRITLAGKRYLLVHATPRDPLDEYLLKDPEVWSRRIQNAEADIVCVGHSHMQFNLLVDRTVVLNPGSVGLPRDGDPRAAYAIIEDNRIELKRVAYPVEETIRSIEATDWPRRAKDLMAQVLRTGRLPGVPSDPDAETDDEAGLDLAEAADTASGPPQPST